MTEAPATVTRRGRPRSERARKAILAATIELLREQGLHATCMDDVAARAGVSKATIHRWWPSKEVLALDASATETGSLRGDLLARLLPLVRDLELALDLIHGPIYHRLLHGHARVGERFCRRVVDAVLEAIRMPDAAP